MNATEILKSVIGKTVAGVVIHGQSQSEEWDDEIYEMIAIQFTDGTSLNLHEEGQDGVISVDLAK